MRRGAGRRREGAEEEAAVGLTIWRLPGGGFAVGRFAGERRPEKRELPVAYTEMDGGFNNGPSTEMDAITSILRNVFACLVLPISYDAGAQRRSVRPER